MTGLVAAPDPEEAARDRRLAQGLSTGPDAAVPDEPREVTSELDRLLARARQKMAADEHHAAMALLNQALRLDGTRAETYLLQAECMLAGDQPDRALETTRTARRYTSDGPLIERIEAVRARCLAELSAAQLEHARTCLRHRDPRRALVHLAHAPQAPPDVVTYARGERLLDPPQLETVLRWLTREELDEAEEALAAHDFDRAGRACRAAWHIDDRGTRCALLAAHALWGVYTTAIARRPQPPLSELRSILVQAKTFLKKSADDGTLGAEHRPLTAAVDRELRDIAKLLAEQESLREVNELRDKYLTLMQTYQRSSLYEVEARNLMASLVSIESEVARARERHPPASAAGQSLAALADAIAGTREHLRRLLG